MKFWLMIALTGVSVAFAVGSYALVVRNAQARRVDTATSTLANCQAIEDVKAELRGTIQDNLKQLPLVAYYRDHPNELRDARLAAQASLARFSAFDCYSLPTVRAVGLKPKP